MGITTEYLDNSHESDPSTIVVGKDILIRFKPTVSVASTNKALSELIATADLLTDTAKLEKLRALQILTDEIDELASTSIRMRDSGSFDLSLLKKFFAHSHQKMKEKSDEIQKLEDDLELYPAEDHRVYFCPSCSAYLGLATALLPDNCKACGETLQKDISKAETLRYLDGPVRNYLQGIWIQDYIGKILDRMGWQTWTECAVMGSSGVYHQIDILAINKTKGRALIAECKRSALGDHAFKLVARFLDIQPSFGLLITLTKLNSDHGRNLLMKKPGLKLVELEGSSDRIVEETLAEYISREN